jgi:RNA polymerase sigma factor (sigma-70 family)
MPRAQINEAVDARIVALAQAADAQKAAELLAKTYQGFVRDYVRRRVKANAVDEVWSQVWAVVAKNVPADLRSPRGYLIGIARHKIGHALDQRSFDAIDSALAEQPMWRSRSGSARSKLARAQQIEEVRAAIAALDPEDRELIQLSFHEGLRPAEIAVAMGRGTDPKTVSKQISRAVDALRDRVKR